MLPKQIGMTPSDYMHEMRDAFDKKLYIAALSLAMVLPDVCATALDAQSRTCKEKYIDWLEKYLIPIVREDANSELASKDIYQARNAVLHNGSLALDAGKLTKYHNIRFYILLENEQLIISSGSISLGCSGTHSDFEKHLSINLERYIIDLEKAVKTFLDERPDCNKAIDKGRLSYSAIVDFP